MFVKLPLGPLARRDPRSLPRKQRLPAIYRLLADEHLQVAGKGELARDPQVALVEAALFAADEPLTPRRLATLTGLQDGNEIRLAVRRLQGLYEKGSSAFQIEELAGGYQLLTRPDFHPWLIRLRHTSPEMRLSPAARETLAIVAYRQPIMRADIESIRGVQCGDILRVLMEKGLIRITGRHHSLGRPVLYGTTRKFLQLFGLMSLEELPAVEKERRSRDPVRGRTNDGT
jgi:segregation and condensation protein B